MNRKQLLLVGYLILTLFVINSCSDSGEEIDPCLNGPEISVDFIMTSIEGKATGEIAVSATGGSGTYMFSLDGTNFQNSGTFSDLAADDYTIEVKDGNDCKDSEMVTVEEIPEVFYANQIRPIIDNNCQFSPCHGSDSSIPSWETYANVKAKAAIIKTQTGNGSMPPTGPLSAGDVQLIADWVNQGAQDN